MLVAAGPDLTSLIDYTMQTPADSMDLHSVQGDTLDEFKCVVLDTMSQYTILPEDELVVLDETDTNGWPTVNLLANPSFEGTYTAGYASSWTNSNFPSGITAASSATAKFGSKSQGFTFANAPVTTGIIPLIQKVTLPVDENGNPLVALPYSVSIWYQVTTTLSNVSSFNLNVEWWKANFGTFISTNSVALTTGTTGTWQRAFVNVATPPAAATGLKITITCNTTSATNSGVIIFDGAQVERCTFAKYRLNAFQTAYQGNKYPTAYCDNTQPGCYTDLANGLYYRQLRLFGGYIRDSIAHYDGSPERTIEISAVDYTVLLAEAPATFIINQQTDKSAIAQACSYAQNQGFLSGIDYTTYVTNVVTVDAMVFNWQTTRDVISKIADYAVAAYYVDYYKFLHYGPALAVTTSFGLSDAPSATANPPTYPFFGFSIESDSTQTMNTPVIEGSTQISAPQTYSAFGVQTTLSSGLTNGTQYSSVSVAALSHQIDQGAYITIGSLAGTNIQVQTAATAAAAATTISTVTFTANATYASSTAVAVTAFNINNQSSVAQVDSAAVTVSGTTTQYTIGLNSTNQFSQGYDSLLDPPSGTLFMNPAGSGPYSSTWVPPDGATVKIIYRYTFPVIIRLRRPTTGGGGGTKRRKIHHYTKHSEIYSKQAAIDRANADLSQWYKATPIGALSIMTPPIPSTTVNGLRVGMAISIRHVAAFGSTSSVLYQVQEIQTKFAGNGVAIRTLKLGFYRPNFVIRQAQLQRTLNSIASTSANDTVLQDVLAISDQWVVTDSISNTVTNNGQWQSGASATYIWGPTTNYVWG